MDEITTPNEADRKENDVHVLDMEETEEVSVADDMIKSVRGRIEKIWHRGSRSYAPTNIGTVKWHTPVESVCADTFLLVIPDGQNAGRPVDIGGVLLERLGWKRMTQRRLKALIDTAPNEITLLATTEWRKHIRREPADGKFYMGLSDEDLDAWFARVKESLRKE
ncbi:hypothetical protein KKF55_02235 [Patescibacteria group bacterium]|nr:hypothetical protein [Patescibacteria group bacterium]